MAAPAARPTRGLPRRCSWRVSVRCCLISAALDAMGGAAVMVAIGARHMDEPVTARLHRFAKLGTIDLRIDYLRPAIGEFFTMTAEVLRLGSRVASVRMLFLGADGKLLATGAAAYMVS